MKSALNLATSRKKLFLEPEVVMYLKSIEPKQVFYTKEQEQVLIREAHAGNITSRNKLVDANLKFVVSCAKEFWNPKVKTMELISAGNLGLILAVDKYNFNSDSKLISCAVWWINAEIQNYLNSNTLIHVPLNKIKEVEKIKKQIKENDERNSSLFTAEDFLSASSVKVRQAFCSLETPSTIVSQSADYDQQTPNKDEVELRSTNKIDSTNVFDSQDNLHVIQKYLNVLTPIEKDIFVAKYGIFGDEAKPVEVLSSNFNVSTFVVKKTLKSAKAKIKGIINIEELI